jgi:hypothetical protein
MDSKCYLRNCTLLTEQRAAVKNLCQVPDTVQEDIDGCKRFLPTLSISQAFDESRLTCVVIGMTQLPGGGSGE